MARAATTTDAFNAVAEPRRRQILDVLTGGELAVNDVVHRLGLSQPQVSKHLRVLREVGAVDVREDGRQRFYRLNGEALKPIHDWIADTRRRGRSASTGWTRFWKSSRRRKEMEVTTSRSAKVTLPTDDQILITREFDAPSELVYKAFTTPELVRRWWHAKRGEMTVADIDLRVGGTYRFVMDSGGFEVGFHGEYLEIVPGEKIVSSEVYEGLPEGVTEEDGRR